MLTPDLMSGVVLVGHGGYEMLEWRDDLAVPQPGPGDVLIRLTAAGVNNTDINTRTGWYSKGDGDAADAGWTGAPLSLPRIQGADACGRIMAVGGGVEAIRVGERVLVEPSLQEANGKPLETPWYLGSECDGAFAQYLVVAARHAHAIDCDLSDVELASFPCSYSTAENMLTRAGVRAGERVLVTGASGGVGSAAVQLAAARGAEVIAQTSPAKAERLMEIGAAHTVARDDDLCEVVGRGQVDAVVDLVAGPQWPSLLEVLRPRGRYAASGAISGPIVELDVRTLYLKDLSLFGCTVLDDGVFASLVGRIARSEIKPLVAQTFPLGKIAEAQEAFTRKNHVGKIVLTID